MDIGIYWTKSGNLSVDNIIEDTMDITIIFHNADGKSNLEKLKYLLGIVQAALNIPELTGEDDHD